MFRVLTSLSSLLLTHHNLIQQNIFWKLLVQCFQLLAVGRKYIFIKYLLILTPAISHTAIHLYTSTEVSYLWRISHCLLFWVTIDLFWISPILIVFVCTSQFQDRKMGHYMHLFIQHWATLCSSNQAPENNTRLRTRTVRIWRISE